MGPVPERPVLVAPDAFKRTFRAAQVAGAIGRGLERDGLVLRHVYARVPARVEYELSDTGEELLMALAPLLDWGKIHQLEIAEARERFDRLQLWRAAGQEMQQSHSTRQPRVPGVY